MRLHMSHPEAYIAAGEAYSNLVANCLDSAGPGAKPTMAAYAYDPNAQPQYAAPAPSPVAAYAAPTGNPNTSHSSDFCETRTASLVAKLYGILICQLLSHALH